MKNIPEQLRKFSPVAGIILGSGLGDLAKKIAVEHVLAYPEIPDFPQCTAPGHEGRLILGALSGKKVMAFQGRFHYYEGYSMNEIAAPVKLMKDAGVRSMIVSNAAGGMNPEFEVGELMIINDHISLFPDNPLIRKHRVAGEPFFVDMSEAYDKEYITMAKDAAGNNNIEVSEGIYIGLTGPCFETPAEYRYLRRIGGDAVGMSTVPEVIAARYAGLKVFGISIITDLGIEGRVEKITHEQVLSVAAEREPSLSLIITELVARL